MNEKELYDKMLPLAYTPWHGGNDEATSEECANELVSIAAEYAKQQSIAFFKWYGGKMASFIEYITKVKPIVRSEEIEERITEHEGATFDQLYAQFIEQQSPNK